MAKKLCSNKAKASNKNRQCDGRMPHGSKKVPGSASQADAVSDESATGDAAATGEALADRQNLPQSTLGGATPDHQAAPAARVVQGRSMRIKARRERWADVEFSDEESVAGAAQEGAGVEEVPEVAYQAGTVSDQRATGDTIDHQEALAACPIACGVDELPDSDTMSVKSGPENQLPTLLNGTSRPYNRASQASLADAIAALLRHSEQQLKGDLDKLLSYYGTDEAKAAARAADTVEAGRAAVKALESAAGACCGKVKPEMKGKRRRIEHTREILRTVGKQDATSIVDEIYRVHKGWHGSVEKDVEATVKVLLKETGPVLETCTADCRSICELLTAIQQSSFEFNGPSELDQVWQRIIRHHMPREWMGALKSDADKQIAGRQSRLEFIDKLISEDRLPKSLVETMAKDIIGCKEGHMEHHQYACQFLNAVRKQYRKCGGLTPQTSLQVREYLDGLETAPKKTDNDLCDVMRFLKLPPQRGIIYYDNSNFFIPAQKIGYGRIDFTALCKRVRSFLRDVVGGSPGQINEKHMYCSEPPECPGLWEAAKDAGFIPCIKRKDAKGKEKEVDTQLVADMVEKGMELKGNPVELEVTWFILLSGDRDMLPAVKKLLDYGFQVLIIACEEHTCTEFKQLPTIPRSRCKWLKLDDHFDEVFVRKVARNGDAE